MAGVVERDGHGFAAGQRVVALVGTGGYAEQVAAPAASTFAIADEVGDATALALLLQGLTAWNLYSTCARIRPGRAWSCMLPRAGSARSPCSSARRSARAA